MSRSVLFALIAVLLLTPYNGYASHNEASAIERMYNRHNKPLVSDLDAPVAVSVVRNSSGYLFEFSNPAMSVELRDSYIADILDQGESGFLFRTTIEELPHIRVDVLPDNIELK